jgi:hypothetical protein
VILLGNVGGSMWPAFAASPEGQTGSDRLDRWTRRGVAELAGRLGGQPLYPFGGPPYWPFQRWAQRAEAVHPSPLGLLIHPDHGLWHAYRAALLFAEVIDLPPRDERPSPCTTCAAGPVSPPARSARSPAPVTTLPDARSTSRRRPAPIAWISAAARDGHVRLGLTTPTAQNRRDSTWRHFCAHDPLGRERRE